MSFQRANLAGWSLFEVLTSAQQNALDIDHASAVDGAGGGTYAPSSAIVIGGAGLHVTAGTILTDVTVNGEIFINDGLNVNDNLTVNAAGDLDVDGDTTLDNVTIDGEFECNDNDPVFTQGLAVDGIGLLASHVAASLSLSSAGTLTVDGVTILNDDLAVVGLSTLASLLCGPAIMGVMQVNDKLTFSGAGRLQYRQSIATDADATYQPNATDTVWLPSGVLTATRIWTIGDTGAENGMRMTLIATKNATGFNISVKRSDTSLMITLGNGDSCILERVSGQWEVAIQGEIG